MPGAKSAAAQRLAALRVVDAAAWRREVARAVRASGGNVREAAGALGVAWRTVKRWVSADAALTAAVNDARAATAARRRV